LNGALRCGGCLLEGIWVWAAVAAHLAAADDDDVRQVADLGRGNQMSLEELRARLAAAKQRQLEEVSPACKPACLGPPARAHHHSQSIIEDLSNVLLRVMAMLLLLTCQYLVWKAWL